MNHARCRQYIAMHFGEEAAENVLVYERAFPAAIWSARSSRK